MDESMKETLERAWQKAKGTSYKSWKDFSQFCEDVGEPPSQDAELEKKIIGNPWRPTNVKWVIPEEEEEEKVEPKHFDPTKTISIPPKHSGSTKTISIPPKHSGSTKTPGRPKGRKVEKIGVTISKETLERVRACDGVLSHNVEEALKCWLQKRGK